MTTLETVRDEIERAKAYAIQAGDWALKVTASLQRGDGQQAQAQARSALRCASRAELSAQDAIERLREVAR